MSERLSPADLVIGQSYGRLTLVSVFRKGPYAYWNCRCDCGTEKAVRANHIASGATKSCGCGRRGAGGVLTAERLREVLFYDPATGVFTRRITLGGVRPGDIAGNATPHGYREIGVDGEAYYAHRLAWLYVHGCWPAARLDHRDGNRSNNRINNLREATAGQNSANKTVNKTSRSGIKGVSAYGASGRWQATFAGQHLGYFDSAEDAARAYDAASRAKYGDFAKTPFSEGEAFA